MKLSKREISACDNIINCRWNSMEIEGRLNRNTIQSVIRSWRRSLGNERKLKDKKQIILTEHSISFLVKKHKRFLKRESY